MDLSHSTILNNNADKTIEAFIDYGDPGQRFWDQYKILWSQSAHPSAFQAPHFLQSLAKHTEGAIAVYKFFRDRELVGAAFFQKHKGTFQFLSDLKADHNFFVIHRDCHSEEIQMFFNLFLEEVKGKKWALTLNNQPSWATYWDFFKNSLQKSDLYKDCLRYSVCPVLELDSSEEIGKHLPKSKNTRNNKNKLLKKHGAVFEVFRDARDLDDWVEDFSNAHLKRWAATNTPSEYVRSKQRKFLKDCLLAWIADGILVRFSIKVKDKRIALNITLTEGDTLIGHSKTYDPAYSKYSPGKVLLHFVGKWMEENGFSKLDFGDGNESFKYKYANKELGLIQVFISSPYHLPYIIKAKVIKAVRQNNGVYKIYLERIKPFLPRWLKFIVSK